MSDTVYGVSPGLVLHEIYTVGCGKVNCGKAAREGALGYDLGAPSLTIVTCVIVGANIVRPQRDRSLRKERPQRDRSLRKEQPRIRVTITWEHTVLPYRINVADEFTDGGVRPPPYGTDSIRTFILHSPFSILHYSAKKNSVPLYSSGTL